MNPESITIKSYSDLLSDVEFFEFLKTEATDDRQLARANLWHDDWKAHANTIPHILKHTDRFNGTRGEFYVIFAGNSIIGCGGVYVSEFSADIGIAGVRTWINKDYRHLSLNKDYLLVAHKKWCNDRRLKVIALSFNDYNKNIIQIFKRNRLGEKNGRINSRELHHLFFTGLNEVPFPVIIQHTPQWVIYEKIDPCWEFDWNSIKGPKCH